MRLWKNKAWSFNCAILVWKHMPPPLPGGIPVPSVTSDLLFWRSFASSGVRSSPKQERVKTLNSVCSLITSIVWRFARSSKVRYHFYDQWVVVRQFFPRGLNENATRDTFQWEEGSTVNDVHRKDIVNPSIILRTTCELILFGIGMLLMWILRLDSSIIILRCNCRCFCRHHHQVLPASRHE